MILFVCAGNTCRSPMAELLARDMLAKRLRCKIEALEDRGVIVRSVGMAAAMGAHASPEAVEVMAEAGLDLSGHETHPVTEPLVRHADVIFTMTQSQRQSIVAQWPGAAKRTSVLSADGGDVVDPIGGPKERYRHCADQIRAELGTRLDELEL
ncbi:MAG: low molecular weight protein arginine phosphatase [Planctomycetia bacterium]|nr:low molecular weight protein arginine phosphatase [Planctomycetia bacterium]